MDQLTFYNFYHSHIHVLRSMHRMKEYMTNCLSFSFHLQAAEENCKLSVCLSVL